MTFVTFVGNERHTRKPTECVTMFRMLQDRRTAYYVSTHQAPAPCEHCRRVIRHERWCIMVNRNVYYAYLVVAEADKLTLVDELILHSLGVRWTADTPELAES